MNVYWFIGNRAAFAVPGAFTQALRALRQIDLTEADPDLGAGVQFDNVEDTVTA